MAYVTIEKDGVPWMLCHAVHDEGVERQMASARVATPAATFTHRLSTAVESQQCAEAMDAQEGLIEDPFQFFAVPFSDEHRN